MCVCANKGRGNEVVHNVNVKLENVAAITMNARNALLGIVELVVCVCVCVCVNSLQLFMLFLANSRRNETS